MISAKLEVRLKGWWSGWRRRRRRRRRRCGEGEGLSFIKPTFSGMEFKEKGDVTD